ncbi:hypothetical protein [Arcticibacter eurypsychrophilus]|uniref:hypothetical protein n=1 Tax=Arcticibacter eurypsychrophilus TaxID=1434752 RepID=UPI00084D86BB|nr:hypothetical protein [Arcticibacter eurypsychrophilus]
MKTQTDNDFDKLFKDRLEDIELVPSQKVWAKISSDISLPVKNKKRIPLIWLVAASISLLFVLSLVLIPGKEPIKLQASIQPSTEYKEPVIPVKAKRGSVGRLKGIVFLNRLASMRVEKDKRLKSYKITGKAIADNIKNLPLLTEVNVENPVVILPPVVILKEETVVIASIPSFIAMHDPSVLKEINPRRINNEQTTDVDYQDKQTGIRSIGDLVNFVVRHVDHRDEKIIEFSNHDEGSSLTGINLGLIKIRAKQNDIKSN